MILNIHKPIGWTSFDVVKKVRWIIKEKKVGHGGTLDPFAEGVLIIGTGQDTKKLTSITTEDKSYTAIIKLGEITNTLDTEGEIIETQLVPELSLVTLEKVLNSCFEDMTLLMQELSKVQVAEFESIMPGSTDAQRDK